MLKRGQARIIDFQDARLGPVQYDLVSLLKDSYVSLSSELSANLLDYYLQKRSELEKPLSLPRLNLEEFMEVFELQSIQRCFKACGSFASFYNNRGDTRYLKYINRTLQTVKQSCEHFPEYGGFIQILDSYGVLDQDFGEFVDKS